MNTITLNNQTVSELSLTDMMDFAGGHNQAAYEAGQAVGGFLKAVGVIGGVIALFML